MNYTIDPPDWQTSSVCECRSSALASTLVKLWSGKQGAISVKSLMRAL